MRLLTVMLADIDYFKTVNDTHGHIVGDQVLAEVARRLTASMRGCDSVGRYGGEEFLIILPNCSASGAITAGERLRSCIADVSVSTTGGPILVSVSIGSASTCDVSSSTGQTLLLRMADDALYQAKAKGRNRDEQAMVACDTSSACRAEVSRAKAGSMSARPGPFCRASAAQGSKPEERLWRYLFTVFRGLVARAFFRVLDGVLRSPGSSLLDDFHRRSRS